jgi:hypothetical protein
MRRSLAGTLFVSLLLGSATGHPAPASAPASVPASSPAKKTDPAPSKPEPAPEQPPPLPSGLAIVVADRPLVGLFASSETRGDRLFLPVVAIARALGDTITVNAATQRVEVQRQTGVPAAFDARMNQVTESGSAILVTQGTPIQFSPLADQLLLPSEIVTALLDVSIVVDPLTRRVRIARAEARPAPAGYGGRRFFADLYEASYRFNGYAGPSYFNYTAMPSLAGRIFDGRFQLSGNFIGGTTGKAFQFQQGFLQYDRPNGQRLWGMDFGTGNDLLFMSSHLFGGMFEQPLGPNRRFDVFAGAASSGLHGTNMLDFDTFAGGWSATVGDQAGKGKFLPLRASGGTMFFTGSGRTGAIVAGSATYTTQRNIARADFGMGGFKGPTLTGELVNGAGFMVDLNDSLQLLQTLRLQGRFSHVSSQVMMPQASGGVRPMTVGAGEIAWQPHRWLATSAGFQSTDAPGSPETHERGQSLLVSLTPPAPWPSASAWHMQSFSGVFGLGGMTGVHLAELWRRWSFSFDFLRFQFGDNPALYSGTLTAGAKLGARHLLSATQTVATGNTSGTLDWTASSLFKDRLSLSLGAGYVASNGTANFLGRLTASARLPWSQEVQVNAQYIPGTFMVYFELRGPVYRSPRAGGLSAGAQMAAAERQSGVSGRVYQDLNLNGRFDPGIDQPLPGAQVLVDHSSRAVSDREGKFHISNLSSGAHEVMLDLLTVRAELTLLDEAERQVQLRSERDTLVDFRVIRSGRLSGTVWVDANGNGKQDSGEETLPEVRVLTGSNRDTMTDSDGTYQLADLPPGEHVVLIDEKTLPEGMRSLGGPRRVVVRPGAETRNVSFPVQIKPVEVQIKEFPPP